MSRLVIDVNGEQHQKIKALAALQGKSIKDFVLERIFTTKQCEKEDNAWDELELLLTKRIKNAKQGGITSKSLTQITNNILNEGN